MISAVRATSRWPLFVQLACAVLGTLVCFIIQLPIEARSFGDPFAVFLACAFIVALLFGRVSGFTAVLLSSVLSSMFFEPLGLPHVISAIDLIQIEVFALLAIAAVFLADEILQGANRRLRGEPASCRRGHAQDGPPPGGSASYCQYLFVPRCTDPPTRKNVE